ncbi:MAG TPA: glycosyltransferase, partial [Cryomorphaceae bacterium]|nr:glycosyltransferase [Cryomorphaceae bacterium]
MKILVLLSRVPYPLEKGDKLRAFHQIRELNKRHQIILCCLADGPVHKDSEKVLSEITDKFFIFKLEKWRILLNLFLCFFSRKPFQVMYFYQRPIHRAIGKILRAENPDHIYCQLVRTAEYAKNEHNFPKTIDYQDAFSKGMDRREQKAKWPFREIIAMERRRLIGYENIIFEYFENKTIISAEDRRFIYHPERNDIAVISNGIDTDFFSPEHRTENQTDLVFVGNMSYPPNIETAEYIAHQILPLLKELKSDVKILLAGSSPHKRVKQLSKIPGIEVLGWVNDIRDAYASAKVFIAPMQIGTGLQNKLLEAMAMQIPCVTSTLANRSLNARKDLEILVGDTPAEYAAHILRLLDNPELRTELGK